MPAAPVLERRRLGRGQITRRQSLKGRRPTGDTPNHDRPRSEWLEIPVPPLISEETFAVAHERLAQNTHFARRRTKTPTLLQGLLVCQQCGYSLYRRRRHYRCWGIDGYRHPHGPVCSNRPVRQDQLDALVWSEVLHLLDAPTLVQAELDRRLAAARQADPSRQRVDDLTRQQTRLAHSIERLVTAYQQELVTLDELRERMPALRHQQQGLAAERESRELASADQARYLRLSETLTDFRAALRARSDTLDVSQRQQIVRLVVKEIRVGLDTLIICHSLPNATPRHDPDDRKGSPSEGGPNPGSPKWLLCVRRQGSGFRSREGARECTGSGEREFSDNAERRRDESRNHSWHSRIHVTRTGARTPCRSAQRCLLVRLRRV
jgi:site-specific DNA recombinase